MIDNFRRRGIDFVSKVLPCGHYTTGETPYKFMDGWYIGSFIYSAFKHLATCPPSRPRRRSCSPAKPVGYQSNYLALSRFLRTISPTLPREISRAK